MLRNAFINILLLNVYIYITCCNPIRKCYKQYLNEPAVERFREYLRINTSGGQNSKCAIEFWKKQASALNLPISIVTAPGGKPVVVITVKGRDPTLPSIVLNSHWDVVPAVESEWLYPPFDAHMDEYGDIFARGTQDTKDVGIQYIEAIRKLKQNNCDLLRTVHITVMPDEETGGSQGMKLFVDTEMFNSMNVGFVLDEGMAATDDTLYAICVDRRPWQMQFMVRGQGGHGSFMPDGTAMDKTQKLINIIMKYRETQKQLMKSLDPTDFGGYTSLNINILQGGYASNVIPTNISLIVDMRLAVDARVRDLERMVELWLTEAGNDTELRFIRREDVAMRTLLNYRNDYWTAMRGALNDMGYIIKPVVFSATTDMLVLRNRGIPAVGFSAKTRTEPLLHNKNEYLNVETFMKGIDIYYGVIKSLANLPDTRV